MAEIHKATSSPLARELVDDVLAEFDQWVEWSVSQASLIARSTEGAARYALINMREELMDHLVIRIGTTLTTWEADHA